MSLNLPSLKEELVKKNYNESKVKKFVAYLSSESSKNNSAVLKHSVLELVNLFAKYYNVGSNIDGVNVVITGKNMALITANGYRNKVKSVYPDLFLDVQLVREGDTFSFEKKSGKVEYTHKVANPFEEKKIVGAYCVLRYGDGNELLETLNPTDYNKMKQKSRNPSTWNEWESEFWKKSVVKRACKTNFSEEVKDLDRIDNEDYGIEDHGASSEVKEAILNNAKKQ